jgi:transposase-like protein
MSKTKSFTDIASLTPEQARRHLESLRWPTGPVCPHCGSVTIYTLKPKPDSNRPVRKGVYKCKDCRKQFTVTVGTLFEGSHVPLNKWLMAVSLMCSSKKGISAHQLHRMLGVTYKTAWFMAHRIRFAMQQPALKEKLKGIVEVDETYIGGKPRMGGKRKHIDHRTKRGRGTKKTPVVALVQRDGTVKSRTMARITGKNLKRFIDNNVDKTSVIMTDDFPSYRQLKKDFTHKVVKHSMGEYVNGQVHTNTIEGYFSLLKRGVIGTFHHISKKHLHRYLTEFDFKYNMRKVDDGKRTAAALVKIEGKRLMYREPSSPEEAA